MTNKNNIDRMKFKLKLEDKSESYYTMIGFKENTLKICEIVNINEIPNIFKKYGLKFDIESVIEGKEIKIEN